MTASAGTFGFVGLPNGRWSIALQATSHLINGPK